MKKKILLSSLVLLLMCTLYADNVEKEISELFINVFKKQYSSRLVKDLVHPSFDKFLRKELPDDLKKTENLTGKLFLFALSEYLEVNKNRRNIDFTVYPLPKGSHQGMMRLKNGNLISVKGYYIGTTGHNYLVKVQMGLGIPKDKIIFISMWKRNNKFLIIPAGCVLGNESFSDAAGQHYNLKTSSFYWDEKKLKHFAKFLRETKQADLPVTLKGMLCKDFRSKEYLAAHPLVCRKTGDYAGGTEIKFVKQSNPEQWVHAVFPKSLKAPEDLKKLINLQGYFQEIQNTKFYDKRSKGVINYKYFVVTSWEYQK